jgi:hypothetical protein
MERNGFLNLIEHGAEVTRLPLRGGLKEHPILKNFFLKGVYIPFQLGYNGSIETTMEGNPK